MNIEKRTYKFTGFMPSGNPFDWYYDETKHTAFTTSMEVSQWKKKPNKGDIIELHRDTNTVMYDTVKAYINGELVFEKSAETDRQYKEHHDRIYGPLIEAAKQRFKK